MSDERLFTQVLHADTLTARVLRSQLTRSVTGIPSAPTDNEFDIFRGQAQAEATRTAHQLTSHKRAISGQTLDLVAFGLQWARAQAVVGDDVRTAMLADSAPARAMRALAFSSFAGLTPNSHEGHSTTAQRRASCRPSVCQYARLVADAHGVDTGLLVNAVLQWAEEHTRNLGLDS